MDKKNLTQIISEMGKSQEVASPISIEMQPRLSTSIINILNEQIKNELFNSQTYRSISTWLDDKGYVKMAQVFFKYADEELEHMNKIYQYLYSRNCKAITPQEDRVNPPITTIRSIFEAGLKLEMRTTAEWEAIANMAKNEGCNTTYFFSQWFINEQISEEDNHRDILFKLDQGMPEWFLEQSM